MTATFFTIISLLSMLLFYFGTGRDKRLLFVYTAWQLAVGSFAVGNVFKERPNLFPFVLLGTVILTFLTVKQIEKKKINAKILLGVHTLRIPVELTLYQLYLQNKIPNLMTFKGWNFDILIGFSALVLLVYALITNKKFNKQFFIIWNIIGIVFLLFIVALAILSSPLPIQQLAFEQPNIAVLEFPYCLLPTCVVPIVLMSHILLLRSSCVCDK
ncbi:hypothetical protein [Elizabethkingia occulta]|uniref:hypothetical protein n=1 Tax=Elizabethkingia occulta TaxID=1867263 RepID=UPI00105534E1|nr:hypothetical protein [Elizabethkingia occulta]MBN9313633.1 hypothetical protein [Chryseobacterium sp.]